MTKQVRDVDTITSGSVKQGLLQTFRSKLASGPIYQKKGRRYVPVLANDSFITEGYFIDKATLAKLVAAFGSADGKVLVNFGLGASSDRGDELQLVMTALENATPPTDTDLGLLCLTTSQIGQPTDPPTTGDPNPPHGGSN
jgi:hypothetical protein